MSDFPIETSVVASLRQIMRAVDLHSRSLLQSCGLTGPQLAALGEVVERESVSTGDLARALHLSQATVSGIVDRLESRGLLARRRSDGDRRRSEITATPEGASLLGAAPSLLQDQFRQRLESLEEWERLQILASLRRVASLMAADDLDAAPHLVTGTIQPPTQTAAPTRTPSSVATPPHGRRWVL